MASTANASDFRAAKANNEASSHNVKYKKGKASASPDREEINGNRQQERMAVTA